MSGAKFTPGPWAPVSPAEHKCSEAWWVVDSSSELGDVICDLTVRPNAEADAFLIAYAPSLLSTCERLLAVAEEAWTGGNASDWNPQTYGVAWEDADAVNQIICECRATIAKAKEETQ